MAMTTNWAREHYRQQQQPVKPPAAADDGNRYISGEFGEFIEH
jgi:hypothetical protein